MACLDQNTWHRVPPDRSSQDDVFGFICPDSGMRPASFREHVGLKGSIYADSRSLTAGKQICLLVLFLLSCIISCLIVGSHLKRLSSAPRHSADADLRELHGERYKSH
jgi:hypothetical protein